MSVINIEKSPIEIDRDKIKEFFLDPLKCAFMENHVYEEEPRRRPDGPFQRDYSRIMYSSSFRRLQGKMQLLGIKTDQFFRNRLTHSLEVTQIARSIAGMIQYSARESYIVEAGALAHDLGNPPFGHAGEKHLNTIFSEIGGFEGNAQTLRILTNVEKKSPEFRGLNLTYRTILSVVKYFNKLTGTTSEQTKTKAQKFIYDDDYDMLSRFITNNKVKIRTLDVQIVDIADEIAYAAHDLEDGLRVKAYTIDEILHDYQVKYGDGDCYKTFEKTVNESREKAGYGKRGVDSTQYSKLFRQELSSRLIHLALGDIGLMPVTEKMAEKTHTQQSEELGFLSYGELIHGLKSITFQCINHNDEVFRYEEKGNTVIDFLKEFYTDKTMYLPPEYRAQDREDKKLQQRLICDYISGMMDSYAISIYDKYSGEKFTA